MFHRKFVLYSEEGWSGLRINILSLDEKDITYVPRKKKKKEVVLNNSSKGPTNTSLNFTPL